MHIVFGYIKVKAFQIMNTSNLFYYVTTWDLTYPLDYMTAMDLLKFTIMQNRDCYTNDELFAMLDSIDACQKYKLDGQEFAAADMLDILSKQLPDNNTLDGIVNYMVNEFTQFEINKQKYFLFHEQ